MSCGLINEDEFRAMVIECAKRNGWEKVTHFRAVQLRDGSWETPVEADGKGFPDLFMMRPGTRHVLAAELKVGHNRTSSDQDEWLDAFERCGIASYVWTPNEWPEIEEVLKKGPK